MFYFDALYFILLAPGILLALWAQFRVRSAFSEGQRYRPSSGLSGAQAAGAVLANAGLGNVPVEPVQGFLSDHYDPTKKVLRLSPDVYYGQTLSAVGVAAHEAGHAIQDATRYPLLWLRNGLVPLASIGSTFSWIIIVVGFILMASEPLLGRWVLIIGIGAFSLTVLFQVVNLPVEFDASRRARILLVENGVVTPQEDVVVRQVLSAAALTYVAATLTAILTLLYFLIRSGLLGGRRNN
jgi:Zn-dependent membrane protease YugP